MRRLVRLLLLCALIVGAFYVADQIGWIEIQDEVKESVVGVWQSGTEYVKSLWEQGSSVVKERYNAWLAGRSGNGPKSGDEKGSNLGQLVQVPTPVPTPKELPAGSGAAGETTSDQTQVAVAREDGPTGGAVSTGQEEQTQQSVGEQVSQPTQTARQPQSQRQPQQQAQPQQEQQQRTPSAQELVRHWNSMIDAYRNDQHAKAIELALQGQGLEPDNRRYVEYEGYIYYDWARNAESDEAPALYAKAGDAFERAIARAVEDGATAEELADLYSWAASAFSWADERVRAVDAARNGLSFGYDEQLDIIVNNIQWDYYGDAEYEKAIELVRYRQTLKPDDWERIVHEASAYSGWASQVEEKEGIMSALPLFEQAADAYERSIALAKRQDADASDLVNLHYLLGNMLYNVAGEDFPGASEMREESLHHYRQAIEYNSDGTEEIPWAHYRVAGALFSEAPFSLEAKEHYERFLEQYDQGNESTTDWVVRRIALIDELNQKLYGDPGVPRVVTDHAVFLGYGMSPVEVRTYAMEFESRTIGAVERDLDLRPIKWPVIFNLYGDQELWEREDPCQGERPWGCYSGGYKQVFIAHWKSDRMRPSLLAHEYVHWLAYEEADLLGAPDWFHEGLADAVGDRVTVTSTVWGSDSYRKDWESVIQEEVDVSEGLGQLVDDMDYSYAHTGVGYLVETRGVPALKYFMQLARNGRRFEQAFTEAFGITPDAYLDEYTYVVERLRRQAMAM